MGIQQILNKHGVNVNEIKSIKRLSWQGKSTSFVYGIELKFLSKDTLRLECTDTAERAQYIRALETISSKKAYGEIVFHSIKNNLFSRGCNNYFAYFVSTFCRINSDKDDIYIPDDICALIHHFYVKQNSLQRLIRQLKATLRQSKKDLMYNGIKYAQSKVLKLTVFKSSIDRSLQHKYSQIFYGKHGVIILDIFGGNELKHILRSDTGDILINACYMNIYSVVDWMNDSDPGLKHKIDGDIYIKIQNGVLIDGNNYLRQNGEVVKIDKKLDAISLQKSKVRIKFGNQ